jgi:hypothetical protein
VKVSELTDDLQKLVDALIVGYHYAAAESRKEGWQPPYKAGKACEDAEAIYKALSTVSELIEQVKKLESKVARELTEADRREPLIKNLAMLCRRMAHRRSVLRGDLPATDPREEE